MQTLYSRFSLYTNEREKKQKKKSNLAKLPARLDRYQGLIITMSPKNNIYLPNKQRLSARQKKS